MSKIFISHSSANNAAALAVAKWLADSGWGEYFLDVTSSRGLAPGERWQEALKSAADRCEAVLFLISPAWQASRWCLAEFLLAKQLGKTIFGVLVEPTPMDTLPTEMTSQWQLCDLASGAPRQSFRVSQDPIVPETEVSFAEDGLMRLRIGLQRAGLDPASFPWPPSSDPNRAPYRGLKALEPEDAAVFFGREWDIVRGVDALRRSRELGVERLFVILGASGGGKSSYLRAGLWPRLMRDDTRFLTLPVVRPEHAVISGATGLAASLEAAFRERKAGRSRAAINQTLQEPGGLDRLLAELQTLATSRMEPDASPPMLVISIDQGEELFGAEGGAEAERFLDLLGQTLSPPAGEGAEAVAARQRALAIVAIRSDSYERLQTEPWLAQVKSSLFNLPPITPAEFKSVIEGPAARHTEAGHKLTVDPRLTERLVNETEGADALPLLAFTLERLFVEHGGDGKLLLEDYEALGGVRGAIEAAIEAAFAEPGRAPIVPADKTARERLLRAGFIPWLARVDPDTDERRRRVARCEEIPPEARPLMERLIEQRLLVQDRRKLEGGEVAVVVEVAHEALLRQWRPLTAWLDEDAYALKLLEEVKRAAGHWAKHRSEAGVAEDYLLHSGTLLVEAEALLKRADFERLFGTGGQSYLGACRSRDERVRREKEEQRKVEFERVKALAEEQRRRADDQAAARIKQLRLSWWLFALLALALVAGLYGWQQKGEAEEQRAAAVEKRREAESQRNLAMSRQLAALANNEGGGLQRALLFAAAAYRAAPTNEARQVLQRALTTQPQLKTFLSHHEDPVSSVVFSRDGRTLASASFDGTVLLWDVASRKTVGEPFEVKGGIFSIALSPDGRTLASARFEKTDKVDVTLWTLMLWDVASRETVTLGEPFEGVKGGKSSIAFSPDGKTLASSVDQTVILWDVASRKPLGEPLQGHQDQVWCVAFSPDGSTLASASFDKTVILWDVASRKPLGERLEAHDGAVTSVAFSPDGETLASGGWDKTVILWDVARRKPLGSPLQGHLDVVRSVAFSGDGKTLASGSWDKTVTLWDVARRQPLGDKPLKGHLDKVRSVTFSPDGKTVASGGEDNNVILWDIASLNSLGKPLTGHEDAVSSVVFSPDGRTLASAGEDEAVILWDLASLSAAGGRLEGAVSSVAFSPDGKTLASGSRGETAILWDLANRQPSGEPLQGHEGKVRSIAFSPDGKTLATGAEDEAVILWDVASHQPLGQPLQGHQDVVQSVAFSPDGKLLASASFDRTVMLWDVASRKASGGPLKGDHGKVWSVAFSPDGKTLASANADKTVVLWDVASREPSGEAFRGHADQVRSVAFSPDGKTLASASFDRTVVLWDARNRQLLGEPLRSHRDGVRSVAFSPDGKTLASAGFDRTVILWDVDVASWTRRACGIANRNLEHWEWERYVGKDVPYQAPCPELPVP